MQRYLHRLRSHNLTLVLWHVRLLYLGQWASDPSTLFVRLGVVCLAIALIVLSVLFRDITRDAIPTCLLCATSAL